MSTPFRIIMHRNDESAHFRLLGDFDERAACELIDALKTHSRSVSRIFIHTDSLERVSDYGKQEFKNRLDRHLDGPAAEILPTGRYSNIFTPLDGVSF
jgi:hypothetical protein